MTNRSLDDLVRDCRAIVGKEVVGKEVVGKETASKKTVSKEEADVAAAISATVERFVADPAAVAECVPKLSPPEPAPVCGLDEVLFEDDTLSVVLVDTPPGVAQPPHDHRMPVAIGVFQGIEDHRIFERTGTGLALVDEPSIGPGKTISLNTETVHAIAAGGETWCRGIHVYLGSISTVDRSVFHPETFAEEAMTLARYEQLCVALD